jgi:hypothetical protein
MGFAEFIIGPAQRVRPLAGPMTGSGRTRWLNPSYVGHGFGGANVVAVNWISVIALRLRAP